MTQDRRPTSAMRRALAWALALAAAWVVLGALAPAERAAAAPRSSDAQPMLLGDLLGDGSDDDPGAAVVEAMESAAGVVDGDLLKVVPLVGAPLATATSGVETLAEPVVDVVDGAVEIVVEEVGDAVAPPIEVIDPTMSDPAPPAPTSPAPAAPSPVPPLDGALPPIDDDASDAVRAPPAGADRLLGQRAPRGSSPADGVAPPAPRAGESIASSDSAPTRSLSIPSGPAAVGGSATALSAAPTPTPSAPGILGTSADPALLRGAAIGALDSDPPTGPSREHPPTPD